MSYSIDFKQNLLKWIYEKIDLSKFKFKLIEKESDIVEIEKDSYVTHNYLGSNCLLVFKKINSKFYSFLIDKKTLNYQFDQVDVKNVRITPVKVRLSKEIYFGTIFDGMFNLGNEKKFIITDTYFFMGKSLLESDLMDKNMNISIYLESNYIEDFNIGDIRISICNIYKLSDTKKIIHDSVPNAKGLSFYPRKSGNRLIITNLIDEEENKSIAEESLYKELDDNTEGVFKVKKTDMSDVYNLYLISVLKKGNKKMLQNKKMGIAYIPTIELSNTITDFIGDKNSCLMYCKYNKSKDKWQPVKGCTDKNKPNLISDIYELK